MFSRAGNRFTLCYRNLEGTLIFRRVNCSVANSSKVQKIPTKSGLFKNSSFFFVIIRTQSSFFAFFFTSVFTTSVLLSVLRARISLFSSSLFRGGIHTHTHANITNSLDKSETIILYSFVIFLSIPRILVHYYSFNVCISLVCEKRRKRKKKRNNISSSMEELKKKNAHYHVKVFRYVKHLRKSSRESMLGVCCVTKHITAHQLHTSIHRKCIAESRI